MKKDWCTCFPETLFGHYIGDCCEAHDNGYLINGMRIIVLSFILALLFYFAEGYLNWLVIAFLPFMFKLTFDWKLFVCVSKKAWYMFFVGLAMFLAVATIGLPYWIISQIRRYFFMI